MWVFTDLHPFCVIEIKTDLIKTHYAGFVTAEPQIVQVRPRRGFSLVKVCRLKKV